MLSFSWASAGGRVVRFQPALFVEEQQQRRQNDQTAADKGAHGRNLVQNEKAQKRAEENAHEVINAQLTGGGVVVRQRHQDLAERCRDADHDEVEQIRTARHDEGRDHADAGHDRAERAEEHDHAVGVDPPRKVGQQRIAHGVAQRGAECSQQRQKRGIKPRVCRDVRTGEGDQHGRDVHLRQPLMQKHDRNDRDREHGDAVHDADICLKRVSGRVEQQHDGKQSEERTREHLRPVFALTEERLVVLDEDEACHEDADQVAEKRLLPQGYLRRVQSRKNHHKRKRQRRQQGEDHALGPLRFTDFQLCHVLGPPYKTS